MSDSRTPRDTAHSTARVSTSDTKPVDERAAAVLREHLSEIGAVLDLPTKRPTRPMGVKAVTNELPRRDRRRLRTFVASAILVAGGVVAAAAFWPAPTPQLPAALLGEWAATHPDFAGKRLIFKPDTIEIGVSESAAPHQFRITGLTSSSSGDTTRFALRYADEGGDVELHATLIAREPAQLVMDRPAGVAWGRRFSVGR